MTNIITVLNEAKQNRLISRLKEDNSRLLFTLKVLARNFTGFCCLCAWDPDKTGEECPIKRDGTLFQCVTWLVDGANRQKSHWSS